MRFKEKKTVQSFLRLCPQENLEFSHFPEEEMRLKKARPQVTYTVSAGAGADLESEHAGVQVVLVTANLSQMSEV